jgi:hypothetical protein
MPKNGIASPASSAHKLAVHIACYLLLAVFLSGCKAVGSSNPAALQVTSTPEASVFLDGKHVGKSPFFSDQLKTKEYTVKLASGEASYVEKVKLASGTLTVINRELNNNFLAQSGEVLWLEEGRNGLLITSMPDNASISLDGELVGETPRKIEKIEDGEHKILISKQGYIDREFSVKTSGKYQLVADVTLASEIAKGAMAVPSPLPEPERVEVLRTPQGFLRVRKEPSTSSPEVGRVNTGDKLEYLQETQGWIQIKFPASNTPQSEADGEGKLGWVSTQYIKKIQP